MIGYRLMKRSGILFVISAPSGAGKTTLCDHLRKTDDFKYSISCTTRPPRRDEKDGKDYFFMSEALLQEKLGKGYFLEHASVHGHHYGTPIQPIKDSLANGLDILLNIDVHGARQIRDHSDPTIRSALVDIFLMPPTFAELEKRLRKRATDDEKIIRERLVAAREEMSHWRQYDYVILSGSTEEDVQKFRVIVKAERYRTSRLTLEEI